MRKPSSTGALALAAALLLAERAAAAEVLLATQDGLEISLDAATGAVIRVALDGFDVTDRNASSGPFVRDRQHLLDVPGAALNLLPNPSFEIDADSNQRPDDWTFNDGWGRGATMTYGGGAFDGARAVTIEQRAGGEMVAEDIAVTPGTRYLVQAMVRGTARMQAYVVWKTSVGEFILYENGHQRPGSAAYGPVHLMVTAPPAATLASVGFVMVEDGDATLDMARMYTAPPVAFSPFNGAVAATPTGARMSGSIAGLGLVYDAVYTALADRIDLEVVLTDTRAQDRAIEAGFVLPVYASDFWDSPRRSRIVTQQDYSENFAYTWWGRMYNDGPWGSDRSVYPFAAVTTFDGSGLALGYDVTPGPQDVQLFHSTYVGQSLTALFRLGLAAEPAAFPRQGRYRLSFFRVDGADGFRSGLERTYRRAAPGFDSRLPAVGGWTPWRNPQDIVGAADFGLAVHTYDDDVAADDRASVLTLAHMDSFDYWLPLGDFASEPTPAEARARLDANATQGGVDPVLQRDARSIKVAAPEDPSGAEILEVYRASWMPGSGWAAVCGANPDPEVSDRSGNGWASRFRVLKDDLDLRFQRAGSAGATLDGAFMDWFRSWHSEAFNHRREQWTTCDAPLSFDPATLTPALPEYFSHYDAAAAVALEMRGRGLLTMTRELHYPSFWASPLFDLLGREVEWQRDPDDDETLTYYRAVAGRKPMLLLHNGDFAALDPRSYLHPSLLYGFVPAPNWDTRQDRYFWDDPALVARDRPVYRRYLPLFRLEASAGWEPVTAARTSDPEVLLERWGTKARGPLLFSAWNAAASDKPVTAAIDLAALGIVDSEVGRVVDLVEAGVVPATVQGSTLTLADTLAAGAARLYHLHLRGPAATPVVLKAVKRGGDVVLSWTSSGGGLYELLSGPARTLGPAQVDLVAAPSFTHGGVVAAPPSLYYAVE